MEPRGTKLNVQILPICLRFVAFCASLAAVICFGYSQDLHDHGIVETADLGNHLVTPATGTIEYAVIWSLIIFSIELSTPVTIHPAIYLTFDFMAFAAVTVGLILFLIFMQPYFSGDGYTCGRGIEWCNGKEVAGVEQFATAMGFLADAIHLGFFIWACIATDKLRKSQKSSSKQSYGTNSA